MKIDKYIFVISTFLISTVLSLSAQITGKVTDEKGNPLEYVNIILFAMPDSVFVEGTVTDSSGYFQMASSQIENRFLRISFLGFATETLPVKSNQTIILKQTSQTLQDIVVEGQRPPMRIADGKLTYHLPSLLKNSSATNAYDALKEIPGIMEQNGRLSLIGANKMTVLLNGTKTSMTYAQLMMLLRSTPLSRVKDVEIMYSAPPEYNIRGSAINVILEKSVDVNTENSLQGEITTDYLQKRFGNSAIRANLHYRAKETSIDLLYAFGKDKMFSKENLTANHIIRNEDYHIEQQSEGIYKNNNHNVRIALNHTFSNKDVVNVAYSGAFNRYNSHRTAITDIIDKKVDTKTGSTGSSSMHNLHLDYSAHFGLKVGGDYTLYNDRSDYWLLNSPQSITAKDEKIESLSSQVVHRAFCYANQTHQLKNNWRINYGVNYSFAHAINRSEALRDEASYKEGTFDTRQHEDIWNLFIGFSKSFSKKLSARADIATEFYRSTEERDGKKNTLWKDMGWFPSFNISYNLSENHVFQFELSSDKTYPPYWSLNPSIYHLSPYAVTFGNPQLKPMREYNLGLTYIYKRRYIIRPYYTVIPDYYTQLPYQSPNTLRQEFVMQNFDYRQRIGLLAIVRFNPIKRVSSRLIINGMHLREKDDSFYDIPFDRSAMYGIVQLNNDINISNKPNLKMNISGSYLTPTAIQGIYDFGRSVNLSAGLTWTSDNERAKLILRGEDILGMRIPNASIDFKGQKSTLDTFQDTRCFTFSFIYRFGGFEEKKATSQVDTSRLGI